MVLVLRGRHGNGLLMLHYNMILDKSIKQGVSGNPADTVEALGIERSNITIATFRLFIWSIRPCLYYFLTWGIGLFFAHSNLFLPWKCSEAW